MRHSTIRSIQGYYTGCVFDPDRVRRHFEKYKSPFPIVKDVTRSEWLDETQIIRFCIDDPCMFNTVCDIGGLTLVNAWLDLSPDGCAFFLFDFQWRHTDVAKVFSSMSGEDIFEPYADYVANYIMSVLHDVLSRLHFQGELTVLGISPVYESLKGLSKKKFFIDNPYFFYWNIVVMDSRYSVAVDAVSTDATETENIFSRSTGNNFKFYFSWEACWFLCGDEEEARLFLDKLTDLAELAHSEWGINRACYESVTRSIGQEQLSLLPFKTDLIDTMRNYYELSEKTIIKYARPVTYMTSTDRRLFLALRRVLDYENCVRASRDVWNLLQSEISRQSDKRSKRLSFLAIIIAVIASAGTVASIIKAVEPGSTFLPSSLVRLGIVLSIPLVMLCALLYAYMYRDKK